MVINNYYNLSDKHNLRDLIRLCKPSFYAGCVLKYIVRCNRKHSLPYQDITKAIDNLEMLKDIEDYTHPSINFDQYYHAVEAQGIINNSTLLSDWQKDALTAAITCDWVRTRDILERQLNAQINTEIY